MIIPYIPYITCVLLVIITAQVTWSAYRLLQFGRRIARLEVRLPSHIEDALAQGKIFCLHCKLPSGAVMSLEIQPSPWTQTCQVYDINGRDIVVQSYDELRRYLHPLILTLFKTTKPYCDKPYIPNPKPGQVG